MMMMMRKKKTQNETAIEIIESQLWRPLLPELL